MGWCRGDFAAEGMHAWLQWMARVCRLRCTTIYGLRVCVRSCTCSDMTGGVCTDREAVHVEYRTLKLK